jgi:hypothetical protein
MTKAITTTTNIDTQAVEFTFSNGKILVGSLIGLNKDILLRLAIHGLKQKIADAAAIPCDTVTGKSASIDDKFSAMQRVRDNLVEGGWGIIRDGGNSEPKGGYLFNALCELYAGKKTPEEIKTFLAGKDKKAQAQLRENAKVKPIIDRMKAEIAKDIDTDSMLDELEV